MQLTAGRASALSSRYLLGVVSLLNQLRQRLTMKLPRGRPIVAHVATHNGQKRDGEGELARATELTEDYLSKIKGAELDPHRRHWTSFLESALSAPETAICYPNGQHLRASSGTTKWSER